MKLTVIRHGTAESQAARDEDRALTSVGRDEVRRAAAAFAGREAATPDPPDLIVSSPFVRAVQTAELVAAAIAYSGAIAIDRALEPDAAPSGVLDLATHLSTHGHRHVVLAAHEPILSAACGLLLGARCAALARAEILSVTLTFTQMHGGVVPRGAFRWRATPP